MRAMSEHDRIGDKLVITFNALSGSRRVTVWGDVTTIDQVLTLVEDAMRGAGFDVPFESLRLVKEGGHE